LQAALARGTVQIGTWINMIQTPAVLTLLQSAGLDYARIDMEHSPPSMTTIADMAVLARALGFPILVRPPSADREWVTRLLDAGVWGLHIPQVDTPEIARAVVEAAFVMSSDVPVLHNAYSTICAELRGQPASPVITGS
jgi:2-keto-3-deoxy-L-rhamnonate aldolase RhmA